MNKQFHNFWIGVSVLPALVIVPAMADDPYYTWSHPDIDSYAVVDGDVNHTVTGGTYNIITGTAMRNYVNGEPSVVNGKLKEGVVFRSQDGTQSFKCVSPEYLLKYHG